MPALKVLGSGGYGRVVALDARRVVKLQGGNPEEDGAGVAAAALREMVALRVLERKSQGRAGRLGEEAARGASAGRILLHPSGVVGIEIRRYRMSLLQWMRKRKKRRQAAGRSAMAILRDVAAELAFAHARGYVHRDVKPENVMLDDRGRAHLIDWGMSRQAGSAGPFARFTPGVTTLWYRAPELFTGDAYGPAVDMWSLGVMAVEIFTGRCPFRGGTELEQAAHYVDVLGPPPPGAMPRWPFATAHEAEEPRRAEAVWQAVPQIAAVPHLAAIVDGLVRWRAAERTTAEQLLLNPAFRSRSRSRHVAPQPLPPSGPAYAPLPANVRPADIRAACRRLVDACTHAGMQPLPVAWCAARLAWRAQAAGHRSARSLLLCLDLAAKLVGIKRPRGLDLPERDDRGPRGLDLPPSPIPSSAAATATATVAAAQVALIQGPLGGAAGLADAVEQACAPLDQIRPRVPEECPAPFAAAAHACSKALLLAALRHAPERILPIRNWALLGPPLRAAGIWVATGVAAHLARVRTAARAATRTAHHAAILRTIVEAAGRHLRPERTPRLRAALVALAAGTR
jgi:serine/threonine protein kinase